MIGSVVLWGPLFMETCVSTNMLKVFSVHPHCRSDPTIHLCLPETANGMLSRLSFGGTLHNAVGVVSC